MNRARARIYTTSTSGNTGNNANRPARNAQPLSASETTGNNYNHPTHNPPPLSTSGLMGQYPHKVGINAVTSQAVRPRQESAGLMHSTRGFQPSHTTLSSQDCWHVETPETYGRLDQCLENHAYRPLSSFLDSDSIPVTGHDRPLLEHFIDNVLRLAFPVLEVHAQGHARLQLILDSLKDNKSYFHCCLSVSAIHLKTTMNVNSDRIDQDIMHHRYEAVSQLCKTLSNDAEHKHTLDATLAMVFFHCSVGAPGDEYQPDIPWHDHFQAASNLVGKFEVPDDNIPPPFSVSLATWIDILGATMLGKAPKFAPVYRRKHLNGTPTGLRELMGCDDRVMYLISEICCLEALRAEGRIDDMRLCHHVSALGGQLEFTEPADPTLMTPYTPSGAIWPEQLIKNMSTIFRTAARIYLCSLLPNMDRSKPPITTLVAKVVETLPYIPTGPYGFDRSIVWPLLITGAHSEPSSPFRGILDERSAALGDVGDFGSFGRMYRVLQEVWRLTDEPSTLPTVSRSSKTYIDPVSWLPSPGLKVDGQRSPYPVNYTLGQSIQRQQVHWRDVMMRNGWRYLLM